MTPYPPLPELSNTIYYPGLGLCYNVPGGFFRIDGVFIYRERPCWMPVIEIIHPYDGPADEAPPF